MTEDKIAAREEWAAPRGLSNRARTPRRARWYTRRTRAACGGRTEWKEDHDAIHSRALPFRGGSLSVTHGPCRRGRARAALGAQERQAGAAAQDEPPQKVPVAELKFEGNRAFSSRELAGELTRCMNGSGPEPRLMYEERLFEYCANFRVANYMRGKGYLQARLGEPSKREAREGLRISVPVEEGARYRVGRIKLDGITIFPNDHVMQMLELAPGDVASGDKIFVWLQERLWRAYAERGHIQYDYDVEPTFGAVADGAGDATVDLLVTVSEGPMFKVRRVEFAGNAGTRDDVLRREVSLKEDETFDPRQLEQSVGRLNALGLFEEIDPLRDVEYRTAERGLLDLKIKVKEIRPL